MENKFKDFFVDEIIRISKSEAIHKLSVEFKIDKSEAEKIYNEWRKKWCNITNKES